MKRGFIELGITAGGFLTVAGLVVLTRIPGEGDGFGFFRTVIALPIAIALWTKIVHRRGWLRGNEYIDRVCKFHRVEMRAENVSGATDGDSVRIWICPECERHRRAARDCISF